MVICGKKYNWNNLEELPQNLSTHTVSSRQDASHYGFFGELNRLSNFYPAPFIHGGIRYSTSEQYIQARKVEFCGDMETKKQIMQAATALKCKTLGKEVQNCDNDKWNRVGSEKCLPGILSKFQQNAGIASFLKNTGTKTILECCYDEGIICYDDGIPLSNPDCINPEKFTNQGILGSMLKHMREVLLNLDTNTTNIKSVPDQSVTSALPVETRASSE